MAQNQQKPSHVPNTGDVLTRVKFTDNYSPVWAEMTDNVHVKPSDTTGALPPVTNVGQVLRVSWIGFTRCAIYISVGKYNDGWIRWRPQIIQRKSLLVCVIMYFTHMSHFRDFEVFLDFRCLKYFPRTPNDGFVLYLFYEPICTLQYLFEQKDSWGTIVFQSVIVFLLNIKTLLNFLIVLE